MANFIERWIATDERMAAGQARRNNPQLGVLMSDASRTRRMLDPFDTMRAKRLLAPTVPKLNDTRWLVGEWLRRTHQRAKREPSLAGGPTVARDKMKAAEDRVGPHAWPILTRIVIDGAGLRDCRGFVPELATPWRADAVTMDRLRVSLDMLRSLMGMRP